MTKKGPLGKAEKFYVDNNLEMSIDSLCKDLDRSKSTIEGYIKSIVIKETTKAETLLYQQFARNNKGSTVMTPNASELSDSKTNVMDPELAVREGGTVVPVNCPSKGAAELVPL